MLGRSWLHFLISLSATSGLLTAGCNSNGDYLTEDRLANGLVIILPGIEGQSELNQNIRRGLIAGGVHRAIPIHSWGRPIPIAGVLINQVDFIGNRLAGVGVANLIKNYQDGHPGKPVHVVGHSGGGGVAVFAAEALPENRKIDGLVLLSASISSAYDLKKAAKRCTKGIVNFYNPDDAGLLGIGTTVLGTVDGTHGPSAGLLGFDKAGEKGHENVYQVKLTGPDTGDDPHASTTHVGFVSSRVVPWVLAEEWPAGSVVTRPSKPHPAPAKKDANEPAKSEDGKDKKGDSADKKKKAPKKAGDAPPKDKEKGAEEARKDGKRGPDEPEKPDEKAKEGPKDKPKKKAPSPAGPSTP